MLIDSHCHLDFPDLASEREAVLATIAAERPGWAGVPAVRDGALFEIKSPLILQPGPAALTDGVARMHAIVLRWMDADLAGAFAA